ncbi:MAG: hypothetical protein C0391_09395 [Anaerolinea sp.]|nr:hypothetical protein [Anaerolinea sp.]
MDEQQYLIHEVAEEAGVSTRTIRYYISEGLLPPPATRGRYSYYDPAYIDLIRLIRSLKDSYLPLKEIKMLVQNITPERVHELLQASNKLRELQQETGFEASAAQDDQDESTAAGYINTVMQRKLVHRVAEEVTHAKPFSPQSHADRAMNNRIDTDQSGAKEIPAFMRRRSQSSAPTPADHDEGRISYMSSMPMESKATDVPQGKEAWQQYPILEGVELNIRGDVEKRTRGKLADIILAIRQMFKLI